MCSKFGGDLADVIRGGSDDGSSGGFENKMMTSSEDLAVDPTWQFPSTPMNFSSEIIEERLDFFGDPFPNMQDPLLQDLDTPITPIFAPSNNTRHISNNVTNNVLSRMGYQVSPVVSEASLRRKPTASASILVSPVDLISNSGTSKGVHVMENQVLQISSPRNTGIKRRKSQAKKVVCIPAPAPATTRQSGEVVPSDLWAWRKYGQKPIKGSPYPRGYYRCSSSKGCPARKQVERSKTDPNMLVITYTCEHNHPWPTQRNALAGSTRSLSHTPKNNPPSSQHQNSNNINTTATREQAFCHGVICDESVTKRSTSSSMKEDELQECNSTSGDHPKVKKEDIHKRVEMENQVPPFSQTYRPTLNDESNFFLHSEDFFADLGEIEADPLNILFENNQESEETSALDPFGFYDWTVENNDSSKS